MTSETNLQYFRERVARRIVQKNAAGENEVRWVEVPIEVVARVRDVNFEVDHEVFDPRRHDAGRTSARRCTRGARVVWTSYLPEGELDRYALVSDAVRAADPERAKAVETRWKAACGDETTLQQVLAASRESRVQRPANDARAARSGASRSAPRSCSSRSCPARRSWRGWPPRTPGSR